VMNDDIKRMLKEGLSDFEIREAMSKRGMKLIHEQLIKLYLEGVTSLKEIIRVGLKD